MPRTLFLQRADPCCLPTASHGGSSCPSPRHPGSSLLLASPAGCGAESPCTRGCGTGGAVVQVGMLPCLLVARPPKGEQPSVLQPVSHRGQHIGWQSRDLLWSPGPVPCWLGLLGHLFNLPGPLVPRASGECAICWAGTCASGTPVPVRAGSLCFLSLWGPLQGPHPPTTRLSSEQ